MKSLFRLALVWSYLFSYEQLLHYTHLMAVSGTTWVSYYQKGKTSLDLNEARVLDGSGIR